MMDGAKKLDLRSIACINMHILLTVVGDCVAAALLDLMLTSTMSSCLVEESVSILGKAAAIFRNSQTVPDKNKKLT